MSETMSEDEMELHKPTSLDSLSQDPLDVISTEPSGTRNVEDKSPTLVKAEVDEDMSSELDRNNDKESPTNYNQWEVDEPKTEEIDTQERLSDTNNAMNVTNQDETKKTCDTSTDTQDVKLIEDMSYTENLKGETSTSKIDANMTSELERTRYIQYINKERKAKEINEQERNTILINVLNKCKNMVMGNEEIPVPPVQRLQYFTKANTVYLTEIIKNYKPRNRSVKQAILDTKPLPPHMLSIIYNDIRNVFIEFYVEKKQVPTKFDLLKSLQDKSTQISSEFYKNLKLRTLVKNNLVEYNYLPNIKRYILTENPELAYIRNKYLRQIIRCRESGEKFTYVTIMIDDTEVGTAAVAYAASPTSGLIGKFKQVVPTMEKKVSLHLEIEVWLRGLLPSLDPTSYIVLTQPRKEDTTPTPHSTKDVIVTWLHKRNIPFEFEPHKAGLYALVKLFKKYKEKGYYEGVFIGADFKVIVNAVEYIALDYFYAVYRECSLNCFGDDNQAEFMNDFMENLSLDDWVKLEKQIVEAEKQMMKEDREMEKVIENIFEMVKNGDVEEDDLPEGCKGDKLDNFDVHIGDVIID